jgi:hypothetical protein
LAKHLGQVFQTHPLENAPEGQDDIIQLLETPYQLEATNQTPQNN